MIGWYIVVATKPREDRTQESESEDAVLASWEASVEGLDWIDQLAGAGHAVKLRGGGYPNMYSALAGPVLDLLRNGPPPATRGVPIIGDDYVMSAGWRDKVQLHDERMQRCLRDQQLVIEAWDLS